MVYIYGTKEECRKIANTPGFPLFLFQEAESDCTRFFDYYSELDDQLIMTIKVDGDSTKAEIELRRNPEFEGTSSSYDNELDLAFRVYRDLERKLLDKIRGRIVKLGW